MAVSTNYTRRSVVAVGEVVEAGMLMTMTTVQVPVWVH